MLGALGIVLTMGLVVLPEIANHWDTHKYHDFELVLSVMARDFFTPIYSRFFHMASSGALGRLKDGTFEPGFEALHHIR